MYFESVLSYLATFINDISLMNFSNRLTGLLFIYLRILSSVSAWSYSSRSQFQIINVSIFLLFRYQTPSDNSPYLGLQRQKSFWYLQNLFSKSLVLFLNRLNLLFLYPQPFNLPLFSFSPLLPKRVAKVENLFESANFILKYFEVF